MKRFQRKFKTEVVDNHSAVRVHYIEDTLGEFEDTPLRDVSELLNELNEQLLAYEIAFQTITESQGRNPDCLDGPFVLHRDILGAYKS